MLTYTRFLALTLLTPGLASAGSWDRTAMLGDYGGFYETLPSYSYKSDNWRPGEFGTITVLVPRDMPDWVRAPRPRDAKQRQRFYAEIGFKRQTPTRLSENMRAILAYCKDKKFKDLWDYGECLYMTAQANIEVVVHLAFDATPEGSFENATPVLHIAAQKKSLTLREANRTDTRDAARYRYISTNGGKPAFNATTYCNYAFGEDEKTKFTRRLCDRDQPEGRATVSYGHIRFTLESLTAYRETYDSIGIQFWDDSSNTTQTHYLPFQDVLDRLAPWLK